MTDHEQLEASMLHDERMELYRMYAQKDETLSKFIDRMLLEHGTDWKFKLTWI